MRSLLLLGLISLLASCACGEERLTIGNALLTASELCASPCGAHGDKTLICHTPADNEENEHNICVGSKLVPDHLEHGDRCGDCGYQEPVCGDGVCEAPENCGDCAEDCGACPPVCGDEVCEGEENCVSCGIDCGDCPPECGDQICERGESCSDCPGDCGACEPSCGDDVCESAESCSECPTDCGECSPECGDGICELEESCQGCDAACPSDCVDDTPACGDGECDSSESCSECPGDCGDCPAPPAEPEPAVEQNVGGGGIGCNAGGGADSSLLVLGLLMLFGVRRMRNKLLTFLLALLILPILEGPANAETEFATERFEMPMNEGGILNVEGGDVDFPGSWGLNYFLGYANDPLVVSEKLPGEDWSRTEALVSDQVSASFGGFYVPRKDLAFALRIPLSYHLEGDNRSAWAGLGDVALMAKYQLMEKEEHKPFDLALGLNLAVPTSSGDYMGGDHPSLTPYVAASRWLGSFEIAANVGVRLRENRQVANLRVRDEFFTRLGASYGWGKNELQASFSHSSALSNFTKDNTTYAEVMGGYARNFAPGWKGFVALGSGLNDAYGAPDWRAVGGIRFSFEGSAPEPECGPLGGSKCDESKPEPKPEPKPAPEVKKPRVFVQGVLFPFDSHELLPEYRQMLRADGAILAETLVDNPDVRIIISFHGHTDSTGGEDYNLGLGFARAHAAASVYMEQGVPADVIRIVTHGENRPRATNGTKEGRSTNRRVDIWVTGVPDGWEYGEWEAPVLTDDIYKGDPLNK